MAGCLDGIRVEAAPDGDESRGLGMVYWSQYNRGKKSVTLNLRSEPGKKILRELVLKSDMLLQNFSPGVMDEMGFGYQSLKELNPGIILINVSGFGQYGPYRDRRAFDPIGQAMAGVMFDTGSEDGPPVRCGPPIIDRITALHATIGALAALHRRDMTGIGQALDVCLLDSAFTLTEIPIAQYLTTGREPQRNGNRSGTLSPANTYRARDGWVYIIAVQQRMWERFCRAAGREELAQEPRASSVHSRASNMEWVDEQVASWVKDRTVAEVVEKLAPAGVPVAPVQTIAQAADDPHLWERQMLVETDDRKGGKTYVAGLTVKFSETPGTVGRIPTAGEHNEEIFCTLLGHHPSELARWRADGVI
jgi:crotonobetainyl-CoA:carnitine CoA-transferase CaiB-like acyl-CoA transferase